MTCIIGLLDKSSVYIGGDTFGSNGHYGHPTDHSKVFRVGKFVIGGTTSFRMLDILEFSFDPPKPYYNDDMDRYMRTTFINKVRQALKDGGFNKTKDTWCEIGGNFLVGYGDRLWEVQSDYSVLNREPYAAVGSGYEVALGSLFTTQDIALSPEERIEKALDAASHFIVSVRGPYNILKTEQI